ncbi:MAG: sugar ABC transporter permease [Anaerolineae bacterium]
MASGTLPRTSAAPQPNKLAQERSRRMVSTAYLYILPAAIIMLIITVFPLIYQFWMSFTNYSNINLRTDSLIMQMVGAFQGGATAEEYNSPTMIGLRNYVDILTGGLGSVLSGFDFWRILLFNMVWTFVNLVFHVTLGVVIAIMLNQRGFKFRGFYRSLYVIPWAMPALVSGMIWRNMFDDQTGAINLILGYFGIPPVRWLLQIDPPFPWIPPYVRVPQGVDAYFWMFMFFILLIVPFFFAWVRARWWKFLIVWFILLELFFMVVLPIITSGRAVSDVTTTYGFGTLFPLSFYAVLITNVWLGWPFMMAIATGGLASIPADLYEAAAVDGANWWDKFWSVTVPLLRPAMVPAIIIGMTWTFNAFNVIYFVSNGGPLHQTEILVTQAYRLVNETTVNIPGVGSARPYGMAASFAYIVFVVLAIITLITNRYSRATEAISE